MGVPKFENIYQKTTVFFSVAFLTDKLTDGLVEVSSWLKMLAVWSCATQEISVASPGAVTVSPLVEERWRGSRATRSCLHTQIANTSEHTDKTAPPKTKIYLLGPQVGLNLSMEPRLSK